MPIRDQFAEYYPLSSGQIKRLWEDAWFVFDTNALLGFYRNSASVVDAALSLIHDLHDRLWLPHQVALEYHQNLHQVETSILTAPDRYLKIIQSGAAHVRKEISERRHPYLSALILNEIEQFERKVKRLIRKKDVSDEQALRKRMKCVHEAIDREFSAVGVPFDEKELKAIYADGKRRYEQRIPPGYMDEKAKSDDPFRKYGDLLLWKQLLRHAHETAKPIVFVTNEKKEDWWLIQSGQTVGPHPLLRQEMMEETGQVYYAYTIEKFVEYGVPEIQKRKLEKRAEADAKTAERTAAAVLREASTGSSWSEVLQNISDSTHINALSALLEASRTPGLAPEVKNWMSAIDDSVRAKALNEALWQKVLGGEQTAMFSGLGESLQGALFDAENQHLASIAKVAAKLDSLTQNPRSQDGSGVDGSKSESAHGAGAPRDEL